jgi:hypothetical protein
LPGFVPGSGRWICARDDQGIYVNLCIGGKATIELAEISDTDRMIGLKFDPVTTKSLRVEVQLRRGLSAGIHEWRVESSQNIDG